MKIPKPVGHCRNKRLIVANICPEKEKKKPSQTFIINASRRGRRRSLERRGKKGKRGKVEGMRNTEQKQVR